MSRSAIGTPDGSTRCEACRRELLEETGLDGGVGDLLDVAVDREVPVAYFVVQVTSAEVALGGPELHRASESNEYDPRWVDATSLEAERLVPDEARQAVRLVLSAAQSSSKPSQ